MARISETEFYNDKDVITQIEWLKEHIGGAKLADVQLVQDTEIGSETYGRVTMIFTMESGDVYERYFDNAAIESITSQQVGERVDITFHLNNGQEYTVSCEIHVTAVASWAGLSGQPQDSVPLVNWMNTKLDSSTAASTYSTIAALSAETDARSGADTTLTNNLNAEIGRATVAEQALGTRVDNIVSTLAGLLYPIGSLLMTINDTNPGSYITGTTWELYAKGRTIIGKNPDDPDYSTCGSMGGSKTRALGETNIPQHRHSIGGSGTHGHGMDGAGSGSTGTVAFLGGEGGSGKMRTVKTGTWTYGGVSSERGMGYVQSDDHTHNVHGGGEHNHGGYTGHFGSGAAFDIRDPYVVTSIWVRTA